MSTLVEICGKQYKINKGDVITVDRLDNKENDMIDFEKVLMHKDKSNKIELGNPYIKNAKVKAKVIKQVRDDKVIVFKYKRKTNYKRMKGHKQQYTVVQIEDVVIA